MKKLFFVMALMAGLIVVACSDSKKSAATEQGDENKVENAETASSGTNAPQQPQVDPEELKAVMELVKAEMVNIPTDELTIILDSTVMTMKQAMPLETGLGMKMTDIEYVDGQVTYFIVCDEKVVDMAELEADTKDMTMEDFFAPEDTQAALFRLLCNRTQTNVVFKYVGSESGKEHEIKFESETL